MNIPHLHDWNISPGEAIALQKQMAAQIDYHHPIDLEAVRLVAGVDVASAAVAQLPSAPHKSSTNRHTRRSQRMDGPSAQETT